LSRNQRKAAGKPLSNNRVTSVSGKTPTPGFSEVEVARKRLAGLKD
jgi:hypothetical protein